MFPLKLPPGFHGQIKPYRHPSQVYQEKIQTRDTDMYPVNKISKWQRKISDKDVIRQRRQFLVHPAKISQDNPNWLKSTFHHFYRGSHKSEVKRYKYNGAKQFDVLGNKRKFNIEAYQSQKQITFKPQKKVIEITPKIGFNSVNTSDVRANRQKVQIAWKIGTSDVRYNEVKKPLLKIGNTNSNNFINTYSVN